MNTSGERSITVFLCGDVMTGRGIDQILPYPSDPRIYEAFVSDARTYVELAEDVNGPIPRPVEFSYIWGDALAELQRVAPDASIVNLETSVTVSDDPELVAEIAFSEWTPKDKLRHARFPGLCEDKSPKEVVREGCGTLKAPGLLAPPSLAGL